MHYITDYQLDINKGFMCKVNGKTFKCEFLPTVVLGKHFYVSNILKVADAMGIARHEFIGIFNSEHVNHVIYCDSKQQCYDLCQHIVKTYFKPVKDYRDIISFRCGNESYKFELTVLAGKFMWRNAYDDSTPLINKNQVDVQKVKDELSIKIYTLAHCDSFGFDSREDALKFAKWVKEKLYDKQEVCEKSRRHLAKYYNDDQSAVAINGKQWNLIWDQSRNVWWYHHRELGVSKYWECFGFNPKSVIGLCSHLGISAKYTNKLEFDSRQDAIKFTDYLIETYIIKKEKTYDTNQLRKERTAISRGAKPAGGIIHGRRSKASVRCGRIEHKARIGS